MNTQLFNAHNKSVNPWDELLQFKNEEEEIQHEAQMLRFAFLSEVEKYQKLQGIKKNRLAVKIKKSASYLTQLFRGSKPLNFDTIAKMQKALNIRFFVTAKPSQDELAIDENYFLEITCKYNTGNGHWIWKNLNPPNSEIYENETDKSLLQNAVAYYDDKAIPA